jgi:hypothetical protein
VSTTLKQEMITFHANITEIMRHFWASVPADTAERIAKNNRMVHTLQIWKEKLDVFLKTHESESLQTKELLQAIMVHMSKSIQKALDEYEAHVTKTTHPPSKRVVGTFYK